MKFLSTNGYRFGLDTGSDIDSLVGRIQLTVNGDDLIATMVFDLKVNFIIKGDFTQTVHLSYTGDLVVPPALLLRSMADMFHLRT